MNGCEKCKLWDENNVILLNDLRVGRERLDTTMAQLQDMKRSKKEKIQLLLDVITTITEISSDL